MDDLRFEPSNDFLCVIETFIPNPIPEKYRDLVYSGPGTLLSAGLANEGNKWSLFLNQFKHLNPHELSEIVTKMNNEFTRKGFGALARLRDGIIVVDVSEEVNDLLNSLAEIKGVVIYSFSLLGSSNTLYAFKYPDSSSETVTKLVMDRIVLSRIPMDILSLDNDRDERIPGFFRFNQFGNIDLTKLILIKTEWNLNDEELKLETGGIFQNEMTFIPKYLAMDTPAIFANLHNRTEKSGIGGDAPFTIIQEGDYAKDVIFEYRSKWFHDFFRDVISNINGSFFYWGYSNGKGAVNNFYIMNKSMEWEFLVGLRKHWNEKSRSKHVNKVVFVKNLSAVYAGLNSHS